MKTVNISDFFPIPDDETMERFLRRDAEYEDRKNQLAHILIKLVSPDPKKYPSALIRALFDPQYKASHRWPTIK